MHFSCIGPEQQLPLALQCTHARPADCCPDLLPAALCPRSADNLTQCVGGWMEGVNGQMNDVAGRVDGLADQMIDTRQQMQEAECR